MIRHIEFHVTCDLCGFHDPGRLAQPTRKLARVAAKERGFTRVRINGEMMDVCQDCPGNILNQASGNK